MKVHPFFKYGTLPLGMLLVSMLTVSLADKSGGWPQAVLLEVFGVAPALAQAPPLADPKMKNDEVRVARAKRPAATQESPEEAQMKKLPPAIPPGQLRRPSKAELVNECNKQPECRAKMQAAQQGKAPKERRPAAREESPEDQEMKKLPPPAKGLGLGQKPQSHLLPSEEGTSLLSWLNPFDVSAVYAQAAFSVHLDPINRYISNPYSYLTLYGNIKYHAFFLYGYGSWTSSQSENKPYAYFRTTVPASGYYIINVQGSSAKAKLRHLYNGPIIETWDTTTQGCNPCNYATMEYLEQGGHYFYFWPDTNTSLYFYSVTIESYP